MANQGAAGTRIQLIDNSAVTIVENPTAIGGVVGFSTRGEFNKIHRLSSTSQIDSVLGNGYNNSRYNQGLYATRALLLGGGNTEFVRPLSESDIKTDTYLVSYDGTTSSETIETSFFVTSKLDDQSDTFTYGKRIINDVATTVVERSNVDFELNSSTSSDVTPMFAIMNSDPTGSQGYRSGSDSDLDGDFLNVKVAKHEEYTSHTTTVTVDFTDFANLVDADTMVLTSTNGLSTTTFEFAAVDPSNANEWVDISTPANAATNFASAITNADINWEASVVGEVVTVSILDAWYDKTATLPIAEWLVDTTSATLVKDETSADTVYNVVIDSTVGRTFLGLGLATETYIDTDGDLINESRKYVLTTEGVEVAKIYMFVTYYFAGETYEFQGTVVPLAYGDQNLYIGKSAESVENGFKFVINEDFSLEAVAEDSMDLGVVDLESFDQASFETGGTVWEYQPKDNMSSAMYQSAWELFLDKDSSRADYLVSAGTAVKNLFRKNIEEIDYAVMNQMLNICELRKDMFALFDGVAYQNIDTAVKKMIGLGGNGEIDRWGAIFDGRSIFNDVYYTKLNVDVVKSVEMSYIITNNRRSGKFWLPPAGQETGRIPASFSLKPKFERSFNYAEDPNSDIAKLYDISVNPTRNNESGQYMYGQKTMQKRDTALNRLNVVMLVAGIHKVFEKFLDSRVFNLNTPDLRANITSTLQSKLDGIKSANPSGLTQGIVVCDGTNNTPDIIDTNQLIVDVVLQPTRSAEFITLRTTVQRTGDSVSVVGSQIV
jgi:hypothetical protein